MCEFFLIFKQGLLADLKSKLLDFYFIGFCVSSASRRYLIRKISSIFDPLNLMFNQQLFIFNPNLGVDLRGQLLLKYLMKFNNFGLFGII